MSALYAIGDFVGFVERPVLPAPIPQVWYLLRLHPNSELKAERQLNDRGISCYVPKEKRTIKTGWNRRVSRSVALFPGAMFIPDFEADLAKLKACADGIGGFVKYNNEALRISAKTLDQVQRFEERINGAPERRKFKRDQKVRVVSGPFALFEGRIDRLDRNFRIRVLIAILQGEIPIELDEDQVEAV